MNRLFIIDQYLKSYQGHHFGYSIAVADAALKAGLHPVIATNRDLRLGGGRPPFPTERWFDHPGHERQPPASTRGTAGPSTAIDQVLALLARHHKAFLPLWVMRQPASRKHARDQGEPGRFGRMVSASLRAIRAATSPTSAPPDIEARFATQLMALIDAQRATPADLVLLHTVTFAELTALQHELALRAPAGLPRIHIVLRNDPIAEPPGQDLRRCFDAFRAARLWPGPVTFYSDTGALASIYREISGIPINEIPIPLWHAAANTRETADEGKACTIAYLGDARIEKGYPWLPAVVQDLWPDLIRPARVKLVIQSNLNIPGGEPGIVETRNLLLQFPEDRVRILVDPPDDRTYGALLADADIVLLPYDGSRYRARSSGIAAEAFALGKPVIVPAGTWAAAQAAPGAAVTFARPEDLPAAVREAISRRVELAAAAASGAPDWRARHNGQALVATLLADAGTAVDKPDGPAILYLMDADAFLFRTGSGVVARNQIDYLRRCGYRLYGVFHSNDVADPRYDEDEWRARLEAALPPGAFAATWLLSYRPGLAGLPKALRLQRRIRHGEYGLDRDMAIRDGLALPDSLRHLAASGEIAGVFANYVASLRLIERLGLGNRPVLCESHDIQAFQYAHYGRRAMDPEEFRRECRLLDRCSAVITLSDLEADKLGPHLTQTRLFDIRPPVDGAPPSIGLLAGHPDLGSLLRSCGLAAVREQTAERLAGESHLDLLYVSSAHQPNIVSFDWFYRDVFLPYLAGRGINLVVTGNIDQALSDIDHPGVFLTGRVEDVRPLYAAARIVVLPMRTGAGFNIKTMEALAYGKPIVATRFAMRSLSYDPALLPPQDTPASFADRVLALLGDPGLRREVAAHGQAIAAANNDLGRYDEAMTAACRAAWGEAMPEPIDRPDRPRPTSFHEWSAAVRRFNRFLLGPRPEESQSLARDLSTPTGRDLAAALYEAAGGSDFADFVQARLGREPPMGAEVGPPPPGTFVGAIDGVDGAFVTGWTVDLGRPGQAATVVGYDDGHEVASTLANRPRADLKAMELGIGIGGFRLPLPRAFFDGRPHTIHFRPAGSATDLPGSPITVTLQQGDALRGNLDGVFHDKACGWAWDALLPTAGLELELRIDGVTVARGRADRYRQDLAAANIGNGNHGFEIPLPAHLPDDHPLTFAVFVRGSNQPLPGGVKEIVLRRAKPAIRN